MTSLRERLERKIESESAQQNPMINGCLMYKAGANSLIPLVLELEIALNKFTLSEKNKDRLEQVPVEQLRMLILHSSEIATEALQAIEKFVGDL